MKKKIISVVLVVVMILSLSACGSSSSESSEGSSNDSRLYDILDRGTLNVGIIANCVPYSSTDTNGEYIGYEIDMAKEIAESLDVELNLVEVSTDAKITSLEEGKIDIAMGNATPTLARRQKVGFSDPYIVSGEVIMVKEDSGITGIDDLRAGDKIGVVKGSTTDATIGENYPDLEVVYFETTADGIVAVQGGQVQAHCDDLNMLQYQSTLYDGVKVVGDSLVALQYNALMLPIGDYVWTEYLNLYIWQYNTSGRNREAYTNWFGSEPMFPLNPEY